MKDMIKNSNKKFPHTLGRSSILAIWLIANALAQQAPDTTFASNDLPSTTYLIDEIRITGTKTLDPQVILSMITLQPGDTLHISDIAIANTIKKLWQQEIIQDVAIYANKVADNHIILTIDITENPQLSTYTFEGISKREQETLQEKINLAKGKVVTDLLIHNTKNTLHKHLVSQGYLDATVHIDTLPDPNRPGYQQITISIDKGHKYTISQILLAGNHNIDQKILKLQMQHIQEQPRFTLVKDILSKLLNTQTWKSLGRQILVQESLFRQLPSLEETIAYLRHHVILFPSMLVHSEYTEDKERLIRYYQTQGYQDATIVEETVCKNQEGLIDITLRLEEGQQYFIGNITWVGNHIYPKDLLSQRLDIHPGDTYNPELIQRKLFGDPAGDDIASLYVNNGHLFFQAEPIASIAGNTVDLAIHIQEGPQAYINRVNIQGNTWTHDHVIRRVLRTLPGDKFSRAKLIRSQRELAMLNIFDPDELKIAPIPNPTNATVDLLYTVKELPRGDFKVSGGANGKEASINLTIGTNNFSFLNLLRRKLPLGDAQTVKLDLTGAMDLKSLWNQKASHENYGKFSLQFEDPGLGLGMAIDRTIQYDQKNKSWEGEFVLSRMLGWPDDYTSARGRLSFRRDFYNSYQDADFLDGETAYKGTIKDASLQASLERNSLDNPIYPTQGTTLGLYTKLTPPNSWFPRQNNNSANSQDTTEDVNIPAHLQWAEYHQWIVKGTYFKKLFSDWVLNIQAQVGGVGGYSQKAAQNPFGRFFMGGTTTMQPPRLRRESIPLRGYPERYIAPQAGDTAYKGGTLFDKFVVELRHPLGELPGVYGLIFFEAGNTGLAWNDLHPLQLKKSIGIGIRIPIPIGILGCDWGFGIDKKGQEDKIQFHFVLGSNL